MVDVDGDTTADFSLVVLGEHTLTAGDFVLGTSQVLFQQDASETLAQDGEEIDVTYHWAVRQDGPGQTGTLVVVLDPTTRGTLHEIQLAAV